MRWARRGLVFVADGQRSWMWSHASNPIVEHQHDDVFRVYFGCRDKLNRAHIGWLDMELSESARVLRVGNEPAIAPGERGAFDDSGTSVGCLATAGEKAYFYYLGWNLGVTVPFRNTIGLAVRDRPDGPFVKVSPAPVLDRSAADPYSLSYPWVLHAGGRWQMWYGSVLAWREGDPDMDHVLKYAESDDGVRWQPTGRVVLGLDQPGEYVVCRPCVLRENGQYRMWYCWRGPTYQLGYAESPDGLAWTRRPDSIGWSDSQESWDAEMQAYPCVFRHRGRLHMLYNGNRYGKTGFGWATLDELSRPVAGSSFRNSLVITTHSEGL